VANLRLVTACSVWLVAAGSGVLGRYRLPRLVHPVALTAAGAVTAAWLVDDLLARRGDRVTESCLVALDLDRRIQAAEDPAGGQPRLVLVGQGRARR